MNALDKRPAERSRLTDLGRWLPTKRVRLLALSRRSLANLGLFWATIAMILIYSVISPSFLTQTNVENRARQGSPLLILACGIAFVIIGGGFDLSIGSIISLASVIIALVLKDHGPSAAITAGLAVGLLIGVTNGLLVVWTRVSPFII